MDYYVLCISLTFKDLIYLKIYNTAQPCITATLPEVLQSLHHEPDVLRAGSPGHSSPFSVAQIQDEIGEKFRTFHAQRLECSPHREGKWALGLARSCANMGQWWRHHNAGHQDWTHKDLQWRRTWAYFLVG